MAVEAHHLNLFHPQVIGNREFMNPIEGNLNLGNQYNTQMGYSTVPLSGITTTETLLPAYNSVIADSFPPKTAIKSESGVTYNLPVQRKRSRDSITPFISYTSTPQPHKNCGSFSFLGEDLSLDIQQQQLDLDCLIAQHMEKVRMEIEEKRKRQARRILEVIEVGMAKKLKAKDEEIEKIGRLNWALQDKVKTLCIENQIWRDLAQTNEATANALRTNLEQVLQQVRDERTRGGFGLIDDDATTPIPTAALMDDAQSCCGSNDNDECGGERMVGVRDKDEEGTSKSSRVNNNNNSNCRLCRNCGKEESCVLILPCRHLCLCTVCGSTLHTCPICKSIKNASVHVNMSS
ncbi:BOI-related E3 ubiquitin-protein ligase 1 [Quillaja saponaria]|uniref:RING-type E3 ubiquitin transferase n=1 Tax=Quillaja saponaria TaxID=32244 RepID=A0AAD7PBP5_QUISA|nr:BOI-related E3 ubiquitin-protein ligase 1 [Quillaja saponaria]